MVDRWQGFSNVLYLVTLCIKYTKALTFENILCMEQADFRLVQFYCHAQELAQPRLRHAQ